VGRDLFGLHAALRTGLAMRCLHTSGDPTRRGMVALMLHAAEGTGLDTAPVAHPPCPMLHAAEGTGIAAPRDAQRGHKKSPSAEALGLGS
jgi:hypothetical protein